MTASVSERYEALVETGRIESDEAQRAVVRRLNGMSDVLREMPPAASKRGALGWLFGKSAEARPPVKGLYVHGEVGRGKTMLMDLFFEALGAPKKRRVHFHAFMADVHRRIFAEREKAKRGQSSGEDPIAPVAAALADEASVLCFDEFAVTDIADAMILGRLFTKLFGHGVVVVATSNVAPDDLYAGGLQRANFLPFIALLRERLDVMRLDARTDYRLEKLEGLPVWHAPLGPEADRALDATWAKLTRGADEAMRLTVLGRALEVPRAGLGAARVSFDALCRAPRAAADYLALAERFHTLVIDQIPILKAEERNEAKRFINLIDTLYDNGVKLFATAAGEPVALYQADEGKEAFEFRRTVSRLTEMRSAAYIAIPHQHRGETGTVPVET